MTIMYYLISVVYSAYCIGRYGMTIGQRILSLKVLMADTSKVDYKTAMVRAIIFLVYYIPIIGVLAGLASVASVIGEQNKQAWHDRACKTIIVSV